MVNPLGSVIGITDANGQILDSHSYSALGMPDDWSADGTGNPLRYIGQRWDAETGLYHYRARYYSPALGRFLTVDPIGYGDGLNVYAYVANDPVNLVDPSGTKKYPGISTSGYSLTGSVYDGSNSFNDAGSFLVAQDFSFGRASRLNPRTQSAVPFGMGGFPSLGRLRNSTALSSGTVSSGTVSPIHRGPPIPTVQIAPQTRPLLGNNPRAASNRTNTDLLPFNARAVAKSIYRHVTKDLNVQNFTTKSGGIRRRAQDGTQIRMNPDGSSRIDLPNRGSQPNGETIHFNP